MGLDHINNLERSLLGVNARHLDPDVLAQIPLLHIVAEQRRAAVIPWRLPRGVHRLARDVGEQEGPLGRIGRTVEGARHNWLADLGVLAEAGRVHGRHTDAIFDGSNYNVDFVYFVLFWARKMFLFWPLYCLSRRGYRKHFIFTKFLYRFHRKFLKSTSLSAVKFFLYFHFLILLTLNSNKFYELIKQSFIAKLN